MVLRPRTSKVDYWRVTLFLHERVGNEFTDNILQMNHVFRGSGTRAIASVADLITATTEDRLCKTHHIEVIPFYKVKKEKS